MGNLQRPGKRGESSSQRGYILLTLLLMVCLMVIAVGVIAPTIAFDIKRDREEELIHRGTQYTRAIRRYAKQNGQFPMTLETLTNGPGGIKYLRKIYKDPITGGDFKLLHTADVTSAAVTGINNSLQKPEPSESNSETVPQDVDQNAGATPSQAQGAGNAPNGKSSNGQLISSDGTVGLIFGVASKSKNKSIREFDHKNRYDQWLFFYDLNHESGRLPTGPTSLTIQTQMQQQFGQPITSQQNQGPAQPNPGTLQQNPGNGQAPSQQ